MVELSLSSPKSRCGCIIRLLLLWISFLKLGGLKLMFRFLTCLLEMGYIRV